MGVALLVRAPAGACFVAAMQLRSSQGAPRGKRHAGAAQTTRSNFSPVGMPGRAPPPAPPAPPSAPPPFPPLSPPSPAYPQHHGDTPDPALDLALCCLALLCGLLLQQARARASGHARSRGLTVALAARAAPSPLEGAGDHRDGRVHPRRRRLQRPRVALQGGHVPRRCRHPPCLSPRSLAGAHTPRHARAHLPPQATHARST